MYKIIIGLVMGLISITGFSDSHTTSTTGTASTHADCKLDTVICEEDDDGLVRRWKGLKPEDRCKQGDVRLIHLCIEARFFDPSARVYFDSGTDDANEIDIFNNGGLNPTIDFAAVYIPWRMGHASYFDRWSWGPMIGAGVSAPAKDSDNGMMEASNSPVVMFSLGIMVEYKFKDGPSFALEIGRAIGFTSDESVDDIDDTATFVGLKLDIPKPKRKK